MSARARITSTSFVNDYPWGDFKGNADAWIDKYFDAFLYFAKWGTHILKLRLPSHLLDRTTADPYCGGECLSARSNKKLTIITFASDDEDDEWSDQTDALSALIPIREQLGRRDLRSLYLGWLLCAPAGELEDDHMEPPVPPGLRDLDGSLERLVEFLRIDADLLEIAAAPSPSIQTNALTRKAIQKWIAGQTSARKDQYLERFIAAEDPALAAELRRVIGNEHEGRCVFNPADCGDALECRPEGRPRPAARGGRASEDREVASPTGGCSGTLEISCRDREEAAGRLDRDRQPDRDQAAGQL